MSKHVAQVLWSREGAAFRDRRYSRGHRWRFDGGAEVAASASPQVVPPPYSVVAAVDPEEAFVAALSSCHMLWFLDLAARAGFVVDRYEDAAEGTLATDAEGGLAMTEVVLRPRATFGGERQPTRDEVEALHHRAHASCFLARALKCAMRVEPGP